MTQTSLPWQSKLVLIVVLPLVTIDAAIKCQWWTAQQGEVAIWAVSLSILLALITWKVRAATPGGAATGAAIACNLIFSTLVVPYEPWHTALTPVLAVSLLAFATTALGRTRKESLGTAESRRGRSASQIAANLGIAALVTGELGQTVIADSHWFGNYGLQSGIAQMVLFTAGLAALAEAAADTVSSEAGQVFGGRPRMITNFEGVAPGVDGAVSLAGTLAGAMAAALVAAAGVYAFRGDHAMFFVVCAGGVFGFLFDSLLGATLERQGLLNNDAVNFLSTAIAAAFAMGLLALRP